MRSLSILCCRFGGSVSCAISSMDLSWRVMADLKRLMAPGVQNPAMTIGETKLPIQQMSRDKRTPEAN